MKSANPPDSPPVEQTPPPKSPHPALDIALKDVGVVKEIPGSANHPRIVLAHKVAGLSEKHWKDETMWCGSHHYLCHIEAGVDPKMLPEEPAWAANWKKVGRIISEFKRGCTCLVPSKAANSGYHVTFGNRLVDGKLYGVGGNQHNSVDESSYSANGVIYIWIGE